MLNNYICTLDIGSSKIAACVARLKRGHIAEIFSVSAPSKGIKEGTIVDSIAVVSAIAGLMESLKDKSGVGIKALYTNISGRDIVTRRSRAIIPLAERGSKVVGVQDVKKVLKQAQILGSNLEEEVIYQAPLSFTVDTKSNIANPIGLYSHRLEADLYLISARLSSVQSLSRVIAQAGYEVKSLFFSGIATSRSVFAREFGEGLNLFCDIGSDVTELLLFENGALSDIEILRVGGDELSIQLSDALKIPYDLAEDIKRSHGVIGSPGQIDENKEILIKKSQTYRPIKQRLVAQILADSAGLICSNIKEAVAKKTSLHRINNFIAVGRSLLIEGFIETLESVMGVPVKPGRVSNPDLLSVIKDESDLLGQRYLAYLTSLGMICHVLHSRRERSFSASDFGKGFFSQAAGRLKELYQEYF